MAIDDHFYAWLFGQEVFLLLQRFASGAFGSLTVVGAFYLLFVSVLIAQRDTAWEWNFFQLHAFNKILSPLATN